MCCFDKWRYAKCGRGKNTYEFKTDILSILNILFSQLTSESLSLITELAREMNFTVDEINHIRLENPNSLTAQSFMLLKKWVSREGKNATSKSIFIYEKITIFYR